MPIIPKPPISPDVADIIGAWAERVDNRSLLMDKFVLHKSWPTVYAGSGSTIKMDDASRWSFIRMAQNGGAYLQRERAKLEREATGRNVSPGNKEKAELKARLVGKLEACACRRLPDDLVQQKLNQAQQFARMLSQRGASVVYGELGGRLIVNLSDSLIQNAGICLDRHTGVPYIPGSAVKGVTRHVALDHLRKGNLSITDFMMIFGASEADFMESGELSSFADSVEKSKMTQKGGVDFLAAYPVQKEPLIAVDIVNVHRPGYYESGNLEDLAKETPRPNTFPTVEVGARFAFCTVQNAIGVSSELFGRVHDLLVEAITLHGIGGKTGAGYGWFKDVTAEVEAKIEADERVKREEQEERRRREEERQREAAALAAEAERAAALRAERERRAALTPHERILEEWAGVPLKRIANKLVHFTNWDRDIRLGIVEVLRTQDIGVEVWKFLKDEESNKKRKCKCAPAIVGAIRNFIKTERLEKLP